MGSSTVGVCGGVPFGCYGEGYGGFRAVLNMGIKILESICSCDSVEERACFYERKAAAECDWAAPDNGGLEEMINDSDFVVSKGEFIL